MASQKLEKRLYGVGGRANEASGATSTLTGALEWYCRKYRHHRHCCRALVGVGLARYFGGLTASVTKATIGVASAAKGEVALTQAQLRGTQIAVARARVRQNTGTKSPASRGTDAIGRRRKAACRSEGPCPQRECPQYCQNNLNNVTSVGSPSLGGALGLVGGIPGLVMLVPVPGTRCTRSRSRQDSPHLNTPPPLTKVLANLNKMTLPETADNAVKTKESLAAQNKLVDEQRQKVEGLKSAIAGYQQMLASPGPSINGYLINHPYQSGRCG